jgi:hypothetical protein
MRGGANIGLSREGKKYNLRRVGVVVFGSIYTPLNIAEKEG